MVRALTRVDKDRARATDENIGDPRVIDILGEWPKISSKVRWQALVQVGPERDWGLGFGLGFGLGLGVWHGTSIILVHWARGVGERTVDNPVTGRTDVPGRFSVRMFGAPDLFYTYLVGARIAPPGSASQLIRG